MDVRECSLSLGCSCIPVAQPQGQTSPWYSLSSSRPPIVDRIAPPAPWAPLVGLIPRHSGTVAHLDRLSPRQWLVSVRQCTEPRKTDRYGSVDRLVLALDRMLLEAGARVLFEIIWVPHTQVVGYVLVKIEFRGIWLKSNISHMCSRESMALKIHRTNPRMPYRANSCPTSDDYAPILIHKREESKEGVLVGHDH
jgi:hypothetical protein